MSSGRPEALPLLIFRKTFLNRILGTVINENVRITYTTLL